MIEKPTNKRLIINAKDIELLTGRGERASEKYLIFVKKELGKTSRQLLTISEFCKYAALDEDTVRGIIL